MLKFLLLHSYVLKFLLLHSYVKVLVAALIC